MNQYENSNYQAIADSLDHAKELLTGERAREYGDPTEAHSTIAQFWSTYLDHPLSAQDVTIMLALMKIARLKNSPNHEDSAVDAVAYTSIIAAYQNENQKRDKQ